HATLTVAERACRTADWLDPTRVSRPCGGVGGKAPPSSVGELRDLLQPGAHAPCARQGCSAPSTCADSRVYHISHLARLAPSALRSDGIIGRHRWSTGSTTRAVTLGMPTLGHSSAICTDSLSQCWPPSVERNSAAGLVPAKIMLGSTGSMARAQMGI